MITYKDLLEKKKVKFKTSDNPKKMKDDQLMDWISWLENMKDPNPDNEDARKGAIKDGMKEMKKRGFV